jgi:HPt (histidine-containing phosphotransfer) domain-containing protein
MGLRSHFADDPGMKELLRDYIPRLRKAADELETAQASGDATGVGRLAHQLAGSAGGYGFPRITACARHITERIRSGEPVGLLGSEIDELVDLLRNAEGPQ